MSLLRDIPDVFGTSKITGSIFLSSVLEVNDDLDEFGYDLFRS